MDVPLLLPLQVLAIPAAIWSWLTKPPRAEHEEEVREDLIGRAGVASTPLRPSGKVTLGGPNLEAVSEGRFIEAGKPVEVIGRRGFSLIVRERQS